MGFNKVLKAYFWDLHRWKKFGILDLGGCSQKTATGEEKCQYRDTLGRTLNNYEVVSEDII